jgi:26S proteasome regulatory subunit N6
MNNHNLHHNRYFENKQYTDALNCIATLLKELKRLDDKMLLLEVQLLESKVHHSLRSLPRARVGMDV